ncbi:MAG: aldo/keto reductase [Paracoccaceae bacterium]
MAEIKNIGPIPQLGYGTWNRPGEECYNGVRTALDIGYRHIDGAQGYDNEEFVGKAIADSGVARDDIWMTTKIAPESFAPGTILGTVKESLEKLQMDQVDLLLLHWPSIHDEYDINDYMAQFAEVYDLGLTKNIGVSNFTKHYIDLALGLLGDRKLITNQCEIHVFMQNRPIVDYCASLGIPMTAYSPLARGAVKDSEVLAKMAAEKGATIGQIALAFLMHEGHIVIPSSGNPGRNAENFGAKEIELSDFDMARLRAMEEGRRLVNGDWTPEWDV